MSVNTLTSEQKANCEKLATYLENLPEDYGHFDMNQFNNISETVGDSAALNYALNSGVLDEHTCDTVACAVGHGPAADIPFRPDYEIISLDENSRQYPDWDEYSTRFAPLDSDLWEFLFGPEWSCYDNTHRGAAARMRYVLAYGFEAMEKALYNDEIPDFTSYEAQQLCNKFRRIGDAHVERLV